MRERVAIFEKGLIAGLPSSGALNTTVEFLHQCYNVHPTKEGLLARPKVLNPLPDVRQEEWPYPFLWVGHRFILLFTYTALYRVEGDWDLVKIGNYDWGTVPQIADFYDYIVISSSRQRFALLRGAPAPTGVGATFTCCDNFKGQLVVGNVKLGDIGVNADPPEGENIVAWTKIGSLEWEYTLGNETGYAPMPYIGKILAIKALGDLVIVYGENGVTRLKPEKTPVTTFGIHPFGAIGLFSPQSVAGDNLEHIFVGADKALYSIKPERMLSEDGKAPNRLGYEEFIGRLEDPVISFDPYLRWWWIADEVCCYIYSSQGLSEASFSPTRVNRLDGQLLGLGVQQGEDKALVCTSPISFNTRNIKTLMCVEGDIRSAGPCLGRAHYRYKHFDEWKTHNIKPLDPRGAFFPVVGGTEFRVDLVCMDYTDFTLSKIFLHYKNTDKTFSRGVIDAGAPEQ